MRTSTVVCATLALFLLGCSPAGSAGPDLDLSDLPPGRYEYRAYAADGQLLLRGSLELGFAGDSVAGNWSIGWFPLADTTARVGPQVGTGSLRGRRTAESVVLELNPDNVDNNVGLLGNRVRSRVVSGQWDFVGIAGPLAGGRFELEAGD